MSNGLDRVPPEPGHTWPDPCTDQDGWPKCVPAQRRPVSMPYALLSSRQTSFWLIYISATSSHVNSSTIHFNTSIFFGGGGEKSVLKSLWSLSAHSSTLHYSNPENTLSGIFLLENYQYYQYYSYFLYIRIVIYSTLFFLHYKNLFYWIYCCFSFTHWSVCLSFMAYQSLLVI